VARRVSKRRKKRATETALTLADYQFAGEKRIYLEGVIGIFGFFVFAAYWVARFGVYNENNPGGSLYHQHWAWIVVVVYPVLAWLVANWLAVRPRRRQLKEAGMPARVLNKSHPKLKAMLAEQSKLLGLAEPEMYVLEDDTPYIFSMPVKTGTIVASDELTRVTTDDELATLVAREVGHIKSGHVRMAFVAHFMRRANIIVKVLLFPITFLSIVLRGWLVLIDVTADRVAVLVTGRPALVNETLVKLAVTADRTAEISPEELDAFLGSSTDISTDAQQIERHYKMGEFLSKHKALRERIEEVREFPKSDEGQAAIQKMEEMRQKLA